MTDRDCGEPGCCRGRDWPMCQQTAGMPPPIKARPESAWENSGSSHYEDTSASRDGYWHTD